jgi:lysophospholipase L1-like esterase
MTSKTKNIIIYSSVALASGVAAYFLLTKVVKVEALFKDKEIKNILFVGDSITSGVGMSYSYLIKNQLTDKNVDILAEKNMQTSWMLQNLPTQLSKRKYDRVYIWGGVNDMFSGTTQAKAIENVQAMVDLIVKSGAEAYVIVGYSTDSFMNVDTLKAKGYTTSGKTPYIAYQKALSGIKNAVIVPEFKLDSSYSADGIHPTAAAHKIIASEILKNIK